MIVDATTTALQPRRADSLAALPRYERPREERPVELTEIENPIIPFAQLERAIAAGSLSEGARALLRGLLRLGTTREFPGGGIGIEYGSLLKTATRPDYLAAHVAEAAAHLRDHRVDVLLVPGMSGYPIGAMYSIAAGIPAILLKKAKVEPTARDSYPAGAFVIPSYTGEGDVVMHADPAAAQDIIDSIAAPQLAAQAEMTSPVLSVRAAGADDIIDKATMSQAVGESAVIIGRVAMADFVRRHRLTTGDDRPITTRVELVAWVTPLIKGYNRPEDHLRQRFGICPFAGITMTSMHLDPPAIGVAGVGVVAFAPRQVEPA